MEPNQQNSDSGMSRGVMTAIIIIAILLIALIVWAMTRNTNGLRTPETAPIADQSQGIQGTSTDSTVPKTVTVTLTDTGFSPGTITINAGDTVMFVNQSSGRMWVASAPHPIHTDYPGFDEKTAVGTDGTYSFTFTRPGQWKYHNHVSPSEFGTIVVVNVANKG